MLEPTRNRILHKPTEQLTLAELAAGGPGGPRLARHDLRPARRDWAEPKRIDAARTIIDPLPEPGCQLHTIQTGEFALCDLIPATLDLIAPATIAHLTIATLSFNRHNKHTLLELWDTGKIGGLDFLCSILHLNKSRAACHDLAQEIHRRGGRFACVRCHAKVILLDAGEAGAFVCEGSANLRTCRCIEQFLFANDRGLLDFHRRWIDGVLRLAQERDPTKIGHRPHEEKAGGKKAPRKPGRQGRARPGPG